MESAAKLAAQKLEMVQSDLAVCNEQVPHPRGELDHEWKAFAQIKEDISVFWFEQMFSTHVPSNFILKVIFEPIF